MHIGWLFLVSVLGYVQKTNCFQLCPKWMCRLEQVDNYWMCKCPLYCGINCGGSEIDHVDLCDGYCLGYDNSTGQVVSGYCPYSYQQSEYSKYLNSDTVTYEDLNNVMCGPLDREGLFCSRCKASYGIPVFSKDTDKCVECKSNHWLLYLTLQLLPLTLFYLLVIVFNFSATRPPITAYIFYCQLFTQIPDAIPFIKNLFKQNTNQNWFLYVTWTVCDVWNLDVLRYVIPPFCLDENLGATESVFLELIVVLYSILLTIVTFIVIEMHASNFRVIVWLWKPFHKCFVRFRRTWDPRSSILHAFITFLLLSSFKTALVTYKLTYGTRLHSFNQSSFGCPLQKNHVLYIDPTVDIKGNSFIIPIISLAVLFLSLPPLLLILYPTRLFRRLTQCLCPARGRLGLAMFMASFQGHYKDGTMGTYDYRPLSCIGFVLRLATTGLLSLRWSRNLSKNNGP